MEVNEIDEAPPAPTVIVAIDSYAGLAAGSLVVIELLADEAAEVPFALPAVTVNV
jgi:hypothetical protein